MLQNISNEWDNKIECEITNQKKQFPSGYTKIF